MNDRLHRTCTLNPFKTVQCGKQLTHWVEFQLLDEQGEPLSNLPYRAVNEATHEGILPEFIGLSDAQGVIRLEGLHPLAVTLMMSADPLAEQLQGRRLRAERPEPRRPSVGHPTPLHGPQCADFSPLEQQAQGAGHGYHYLRIGQLCDRLPSFDPPLEDPRQPPAFHFPDPAYGGFTVGDEQLNLRHVLEVCPLRAWSLVLHHQAEYSLANAYNLGLMSILAYSEDEPGQFGSVEEFFLEQCVDLSRTPRVRDNGQLWPCLVVDVPFGQRYLQAVLLNTRKANPPEGDTQLFYAVSAFQMLLAWRGTEINFQDLSTDLSLRPVKPETKANCEPSVPCADLTPNGKVHLGFRDSFELARRVFAKDFGETLLDEAEDKQLFICGHSLGGALGLIHAAALKNQEPLLYTYGMPRTFTLKALQSLNGLWHFRHVNDMDPVPSVPPEADLDNHLYRLYGPLGTVLGFTWSAGQVLASNVLRQNDPYAHHGQIAAFFKTEQHTQSRGSSYPAYRSKDGLGAPYYNTVNRRLPEIAKLYLVPSLSPVDDQHAEQAQQRFTASWTDESRARYFPPHGNPKKGRLLRAGHHLMGSYQPYMHNQLLESISPQRMQQRQAQRQKFVDQMAAYHASTAPDEHERNRAFLDLQSLIGQALRVTEQAGGGTEALQRFDAVADAQAYYEKTYG